MAFPQIGQPLPRAADAYATGDKWRGWVLATHGHGPEWASVFDAGPGDEGQIWRAIAAAVTDAPVSTIRDRAPYGVVCGVELILTVNARKAPVATAWHYADENAAPRLVTAYPSP